jgi:hypothetical protein
METMSVEDFKVELWSTLGAAALGFGVWLMSAVSEVLPPFSSARASGGIPDQRIMSPRRREPLLEHRRDCIIFP